jgi:hypothetical protein
MKVVDWDDKMRLVVETWRNTGLQSSIVSRMRYFLGIARQEQMSRDMIAARCERGADIARRLGFPDETVTAIHSLDEHWNGNGYPEGRRGDEIPLFSRILNIAQTAEVFLAKGGSDAALVVLRERRGRWFDPALVDTVVGWRADGSWWNSVTAPDQMARHLLEPAQHAREVDDAGLDRVAEAFAEIIDAKSPFTQALVVAMYACAIGERLGFDARTCSAPAEPGCCTTSEGGVTTASGQERPARRRRTRRGAVAPDVHVGDPGTGERLRIFRASAATHHEKLDGSGYPGTARR